MSQSQAAAAIPRSSARAGTFLPGTKIQIGSHRVVIEKYLSEGGFAHVYLVRLPTAIDGEETAVLKRVAVPDKDALASMRTEVETMKKLKGHAHVVKYIDSHASSLKDGGYEVFLLMEYCNGGGLIDFMNTRLQNRLTEPEILKIFSDTCQGLASMHYLRPPLLHRDLKVENILITGTGSNKQFKLCDFGSAAHPRPAARSVEEGRLIEEDVQKNTTAQYRSPEMIDVYRKQPIDEKSDIWAMGVFLYKLCYYTTPFEEKGQMAILNASFKFPAYPQFSDRLKRMIAMMLQEQPSGRPNIYLVFKEVCAMRNRDCPLKDIYTGRTASEARRNQQLPSPPREDTPSGLTVLASPPEKKTLAIPEVTPMRRGRPTTSGVGSSANPSPSPGRPVSQDPFLALDGRQGVTAQAQAIDELSSKFPSLDQFSLLHESGGKFAFDKKGAQASPQKSSASAPPVQQKSQKLSQRVTEALADDAFASAKSASPVGTQSQKPNRVGKMNTATQTSFSEDLPDRSRPKMVSTGTMTSPSPPKTYTPEVSSRPIFRVPGQESRTTRSTALDEPSKTEPASRTSLSAPRPTLLEHRSKSQTAMAEVAAATASAAADTDAGLEPPKADEGIHRARSTNSRSRPISSSFEAASRIMHGRSPSASKSRLDRPSGVLVDTSDTVEPENAPIESNVDFLRQMEEEDLSKRHHKRLSSTGSALSNLKRASMPASGPMSMLGGRFGDAFKRFEANGVSAPDKSPDRGGGRTSSLTPIASPDLTGAGRPESDDMISLETAEDLSPEMRRELERRQLAQEERRVAEASAAYKQRMASNGTSKESGHRATAIQNRVQALLDESAMKSPTRTAEGYGKYTDVAAPKEEEQERNPVQAQQRLARPMTVAVAAPATMALASERVVSKPSAPPKPQVLRTGGPLMPAMAAAAPAVARKPAKLVAGGGGPSASAVASTSAAASTSGGQSLLQQRLALDQANSQPGHTGLLVHASATGPAASGGGGRGGGGGGVGGGVGRGGRAAREAGDEDWETAFSKKYPTLGNLEMEEMKI